MKTKHITVAPNIVYYKRKRSMTGRYRVTYTKFNKRVYVGTYNTLSEAQDVLAKHQSMWVV